MKPDVDALLAAMGNTTTAGAWIDKYLLEIGESSYTDSEPQVWGYDNIVKVRAMLEGAPEAKGFIDEGNALVTTARDLATSRADRQFSERAYARLLATKTWGWHKSGSGYTMDMFTLDRRAWTLTPSWWLAAELCSKGGLATPNLFSIVPIRWLLQPAATVSSLCNVAPDGRLKITAKVVRRFDDRDNAAPTEQPYLHWRIAHLYKTIEDPSLATTVISMVNLIKLAVEGNSAFHEAVREMTIDRLVTQAGYATPYRTWAQELDPARNKVLKRDPLVLELLQHRLTRASIEQYAEFAIGKEKSIEDKLASNFQ